tara:strand:- start:81 stop:227 length:147 start_codon:yes stop_codon:yes gene_type:complete
VRGAASPASDAPPPPRRPSPLQDKLVEEFNFLKVQAVEPMATFMEYIT